MRKVLYLLHGLSDAASAWQRYSSIETVAAAYGLVVVMPSAGRSFYIDQPDGQGVVSLSSRDEIGQQLKDVTFSVEPGMLDGGAKSELGNSLLSQLALSVKAVEGALPAQTDGEILCVDGQHLEIELLPRQIEVLYQPPGDVPWRSTSVS